VRSWNSSLSSANIKTAATGGGAIGEVLVANDSKAVVFSFSSGPGSSADGSIYYVEDVGVGAALDWHVTLVGTMSSSGVFISQMTSIGIL
jgi:hypothetical protein